MKYKAVSELCGCGKKRGEGQRDCAECHRAAMRQWRRRRSRRNGAALLERVELHLAARLHPRLMRAEWKAIMDARVRVMAARIDVFNDVGDGQ